MNQATLKSAIKEPEPIVPPALSKALAASPKATAQWNDLTPIARRDFVSWIGSAKLAQTRQRRVEVACSKLESGQRRPCCYALVPMKFYKALGADPQAKAQWKELSPTGRRDFIDWVESAEQPEAHKLRIDEACVMLAAGKSHP